MDWDNFRYLLALSEEKSLRRAAERLCVNHATVSRRLKSLENSMKTTLFLQTPEGYVLTRDGEQVLEAARAVDSSIKRVTREIEGLDSSLSGKIRLTMPDLIYGILEPALSKFLKDYPAVELELSIGTHLSDVQRTESDLAFRITNVPPEGVVGRKVASLSLALYSALNKKISREKGPWIRWLHKWADQPAERWIDHHYPSAKVAVRVDAYDMFERLVGGGNGLGLLCTDTANKNPLLVRRSSIIDELEMDIWLLKHPDLRGIRRFEILESVLASALTK